MSGGWSKPVELPYNINAGSWNSDATISSNGEALIFSSVRDENLNLHNTNENNYHGDNQYPSDIYVSLKDQNDMWGKPFNIGDSINTIFTERSPFLHPDMKTLYFSSDGHGGLGKLDVFMSTRLYDSCWTCWSDPINLGKEINTIESDWGYKISTDGRCQIPIKKLKGLIDESSKGNIRLEVIAEDTYFTPWKSEFEVQASKKAL